jgi:GAF domain-containing protein
MRCGAFHRVEGTLCLVRHGQAALSGSKTKAPGFAGGYLLAAFKERHIRIGDAGIGQAASQRAPLQIADLQQEPASEILELVVRAGYRAVLIVPLLGAERIVGALVVRRKRPGEFSKQTIDLLQTFAAQSVLAIQNARLFHEIEDKSRQLAEASQHKSQFLANMSHELRTPLNAILGYTELILDDIYGETPAKMRGVLERVQRNGKHLLHLRHTDADSRRSPAATEGSVSYSMICGRVML